MACQRYDPHRAATAGAEPGKAEAHALLDRASLAAEGHRAATAGAEPGRFNARLRVTSRFAGAR